MEFASVTSKKSQHLPYNLFGILPEEINESATLLTSSLLKPKQSRKLKKSQGSAVTLQSSGIFVPFALTEVRLLSKMIIHVY